MSEEEKEKWFKEFKNRWDKVSEKLSKIENWERVKGGFILSSEPLTIDTFIEKFNLGYTLESDCCKAGLRGLYLKDFKLHCLFCVKCNILKYVFTRKWLMEVIPKPPIE
ncbi:hypothetical protein LCGC14_0540140 [marine sediment metagenome]|uniref:Uncharacterized protein n=1 Tax=marine sediment metagenome TaxID=412755 RepID=A0A0F9SBF9_9ZZZZ